MILFVKHVEIEGPETIGKFFEEKGFKLGICELYNGDQLPTRFDDLEAVVILGGPMNVYEEKQYPWLKGENRFIQKILKKKIPYLGICLGSQLLAKAAGARVGKSPQKEIGFAKVALTKEGKQDRFFRGIGSRFDVYQWHEDMFEIPRTGKLLSSAKACPHQAFKVGSCAYGLQFHVEITDKSIRDWSNASFDKQNLKLMQLKQKMLADYKEKKKAFHALAQKIYENFLGIICD